MKQGDEPGGPMFTGSIVATVTPMKDGELDEPSLRNLMRMHAEGGTSGIVPAGCTGEAATLTSEAVSYTHLTLPTTPY